MSKEQLMTPTYIIYVNPKIPIKFYFKPYNIRTPIIVFFLLFFSFVEARYLNSRKLQDFFYMQDEKIESL